MTWTVETNRIPWGLLTEGEQAALRACEHGLVIWAGTHWADNTDETLWPCSTYRAKPAPTRIVTWNNVYKEAVTTGYTSREDADRGSAAGRLCVYRIEHNEDRSDPTIEVEDV